MKRIIFIILLFGLAPLYAQSGYDREVGRVGNVIVMIPDGTSTSVLSAARWFQRYNNPSMTELNLDPLLCGMVGTFASNSLIPDSAPSMSAYMTGIPTSEGFISCYPAADPAQDLFKVDSTRSLHPLATLMEAARIEQGKATGLVATAEFCHATPAACTSHSHRRGDYASLTRQIAASNPDLVFGGGRQFLSAESRAYLATQGATIIGDADTFRNHTAEGPLWALFAESNIEYEIDRDDNIHPSLAEMTGRAIERLSSDPDGFFLMVEGSMIDWAAHGNDPATILHEMLAFDKAVGVALDFAKRDGNTLVVIMPDHGTSGFSFGNPDYRNYTRKGLEPAFGTVSKYRASIGRIESMVKCADAAEIRGIFRTYCDIELTDKELQAILSSKDYKEDNYMEVSNSVNLYSVISAVMKSRTPFAFISGNHTGEDTFLAAYHPAGDLPQGRHTNSRINAYIASAMGLETSLAELSDRYFVPHTALFPDARTAITKPEGDQPRLTVRRGRHTIEARANSSVITVDREPVQLRTPVVYIEPNDTFYLPREAGGMLR